jgi:hypothetical protein
VNASEPPLMARDMPAADGVQEGGREPDVQDVECIRRSVGADGGTTCSRAKGGALPARISREWNVETPLGSGSLNSGPVDRT